MKTVKTSLNPQLIGWQKRGAFHALFFCLEYSCIAMGKYVFPWLFCVFLEHKFHLMSVTSLLQAAKA
ncbi:hypothetical protein CHH80_03010 [Bacillus sp. 7504-2]|nr:hypothetical protein CHH80_03010 [Bacillus sp. 7504-2]